MAAPAWLDELNLDSGPPWLAMGTRALSKGLFVRDDDFARDLALKQSLLASRHADVFAALDTPTVRAASIEIAALAGASVANNLHPLDAAGRAVQEDLCVLVLRDGAPHLDAASLCFPSYWRLADKLGKPLRDVHGPVPHYADTLTDKVDGFVRRLAPGRMAWRRNWSIHDTPDYFRPDDDHAPGGDLYVRSERQVLARLRSCDAVLFTIRTQQVPLAGLAERPDLARRMADAIDGWSDELVGYKGGHGALRARDWLRSL